MTIILVCYIPHQLQSNNTKNMPHAQTHTAFLFEQTFVDDEYVMTVLPWACPSHLITTFLWNTFLKCFHTCFCCGLERRKSTWTVPVCHNDQTMPVSWCKKELEATKLFSASKQNDHCASRAKRTRGGYSAFLLARCGPCLSSSVQRERCWNWMADELANELDFQNQNNLPSTFKNYKDYFLDSRDGFPYSVLSYYIVWR